MASQAEQMINFNVSGLYFCLSVSDIQRFPDSYFAHLIKDEWNADQTQVVVLDRDGQAFRYVHYFIVSGGYLYSNANPIKDLSMLLRVQKEADFYNIPDLIRECKAFIGREMQNLVSRIPKSEGMMYECVAESKAEITDPLVQVLHPIRPLNIATTHFTMPGADPNNIARLADPRGNQYTDRLAPKYALDNTEHVGCRVVTEYDLPTKSLKTIQTKLSHWPLNAQYRLRHMGGVYVFILNEGSSITKRFTGSDRFLYIFGSASKGGTVSATVNGITVRIQEKGACIALAAGVSYSVNTVTEGCLILVEVTGRSGYSCKSEQNLLPGWVAHEDCGNVTISGLSGELQATVGTSIINAIHTSLDTYSSVVLCLNSFYPVSYSDDSNRRFETDPDLLTGVDAELYTLLSTHFAVDIVNTCVGRSRQLKDVVSSSVLDFISAPTVDPGDDAVDATGKGIIVAPLYGSGISCYTSSVPEGTILTALMVCK